MSNKIDNAEFISIMRQLRKTVANLDTIGYAVDQLLEDEELVSIIPHKIADRVIHTTGEIHNMLQKIEGSKRYKDATNMLCKP